MKRPPRLPDIRLPVHLCPYSETVYNVALLLVMRMRRVNEAKLRRAFWHRANFPIGSSRCEGMLRRMAGSCRLPGIPMEMRDVLARIN